MTDPRDLIVVAREQLVARRYSLSYETALRLADALEAALARAAALEDALRETLPIFDAQTQMLRTLPYDSRARVRLREVEEHVRAALAPLEPRTLETDLLEDR